MSAMTLTIDLVFADGTSDTRTCDAAEITVGRSPDATVCVPTLAELAPLQLLLVPRAGGVWVSDARDAPVPTTHNGVPVGNALVPWGTELDVGSLMLRLRRPPAPRRTDPARTVRLSALAVLLLAGAAYAGLGLDDGAAGQAAREVPAPALFPAPDAYACPDGEGANPAARGSELALVADARETRGALDPLYAVHAAITYQRAAACFRAAEAPRLADAAARRGTDLQRTLERRHADLNGQLRRALARGEAATVLAVTTELLALYGDGTLFDDALLAGRNPPSLPRARLAFLRAAHRDARRKVDADARKRSQAESQKLGR